MLSRGEVAIIRAEIERLEKGPRVCTDRGIRFNAVLVTARAKLHSFILRSKVFWKPSPQGRFPMSYSSDHPVWTPACAVCKAPVELETCKTDERGTAVHEECYVRKIRLAQRTSPYLRFLAHVAVISGIAS
jgi:hypothetical protein